LEANITAETNGEDEPRQLRAPPQEAVLPRNSQSWIIGDESKLQSMAPPPPSVALLSSKTQPLILGVELLQRMAPP